MQELTTLTSSKEISLYQIKDEHPIRKFIFSTPQTRAIVNDPTVLGVEYTDKLQQGTEAFLKAYKEYWPQEITDTQANVVHFLRGGLNFGLREALASAYNFNAHNASYISSQRAIDDQGRWYIKEDSYEKMTVTKGMTLFLADVVATGVTLDHGLKRMTDIIKSRKGSIQNLVFITIGCHKTEKILEKYAELWKKTFSDFNAIDIVYVEGKFHLADTKTPVSIKILGTDLLRRDCTLAPELITSQSQSITYPLERCTIYDAGSRAFNIPEYLEDVQEYWQEVAKLAAQGMGAEEYLKERYPEADQELRVQARNEDLEHIAKQQLLRLKE